VEFPRFCELAFLDTEICPILLCCHFCKERCYAEPCDDMDTYLKCPNLISKEKASLLLLKKALRERERRVYERASRKSLE